jgi:hypothetical protein
MLLHLLLHLLQSNSSFIMFKRLHLRMWPFFMLKQVSTGRHGKRYQPKVLLEALIQLDYEVDIERP